MKQKLALTDHKNWQRYIQVWLISAKYAWTETMNNRWTQALFLTGKTIRFAIVFWLMFVVIGQLPTAGGYTTKQLVIFFLTYQVLDTLAQALFRGVYIFSWQVKGGELDSYLSKPINPLFRILFGKPDILDFIFLLPLLVITATVGWLIAGPFNWFEILGYLLLMINGLMIVSSFHILVISLGVVTTEVDNAIMLFRDLNNLARFPINFYRQPWRTILMVIIPVGVVNTIPADFLLGKYSSYTLVGSSLIGAVSLFISLKYWQWSLKRYASAGG